MPLPNLTPCSDCGHPCSQQAEHCPNCGKFFQAFPRTVSVNQTGWPSTIAWGIILSWILGAGLGLIIGFVLVVLLGIGIAGLTSPRDRAPIPSGYPAASPSPSPSPILRRN